MMPATHYLWKVCEHHVFPAVTYTVGQGTTKQQDTWSILCIQNTSGASPCVSRICNKHTGATAPQMGPAHVRNTFTHGMPPLTQTPHTSPPASVPANMSSKDIFWRVWHEEYNIRREAMRSKTWRQLCRASYTKTNKVLAYAPCAWFR